MRKLRSFLFLAIIISLVSVASPVSAQGYRFEVTAQEVEAYLESDGTLSLYYYIDFANDPNGAYIEYVDVGMPTPSYSRQTIKAEIDGKPITRIEDTTYVQNGFALNLGDDAIPPGKSGVVTIWIPGVQNVITPYDQGDRENYVNFQFSPNWFDSQADKSRATEYRVTVILPPGVGRDEGVYYHPDNWPGPAEPDDTGLTEAEERVYYSWYTDNANAHTVYQFGVAFPAQYVPDDKVVTTIPETQTGSGGAGLMGVFGSILSFFGQNICCLGGGLIFAAIFGWSIYQGTVGAKKRKMQYLPPKMKIEGHGIKRGLTAVEAAILMEQPMDKILTMILFGVLKKEAAIVETRDPMKLTVTDPLPEGLHPYEESFLLAFQTPEKERKAALQKTMVDLVNSVSSKMKGFSRKESIAYYEDIIRRAWLMVEQADTPEVKSDKYNQTMEWTMLDREYEDRTRRTFSGGPVFVPMWWPRYSPAYRQSIGGLSRAGTSGSSTPASVGSSGGSRMSLPQIPGSDFAANVINGTSTLAAGVVGGLTGLTTAVTNRTNPIPVATRSGGGGFRGGGGGGGGSSCACACACAGCACACAGGGR